MQFWYGDSLILAPLGIDYCRMLQIYCIIKIIIIIEYLQFQIKTEYVYTINISKRRKS